jgi:hypothetical protein
MVVLNNKYKTMDGIIVYATSEFTKSINEVLTSRLVKHNI